MLDAGLSPLARGNRKRQVGRAAALGPIPAGAGKPEFAAEGRVFAGAYPRWRGETEMDSRRAA